MGLRENGWFDEELLFELPKRDFVLILLTPTRGNRLVTDYQNSERLRTAIPHGERLTELPQSPFIGELSYRDVTCILSQQRHWFSPAERTLIDSLNEYLAFKLAQHKAHNGHGNA